MCGVKLTVGKLVGVGGEVLLEVAVENGVTVPVRVLPLDPVMLPEREGVGVPDAVAVLVPLGVCVAGGDTDAVVDELPVRLCVAAGLPVGVPVALDVGVRVPDTDAVKDKLAVAVLVPVAVMLLEAPAEPVLVIELVLVVVDMGVPVPDDEREGVADGSRMNRLTFCTASANPEDARTPMVMVCVPRR